jgi:peptide/nickel transport system substrate-binding protein
MACGPLLPSPIRPGAPPADPAAGAPKTLIIGVLAEPTGFGPLHTHTSGGGAHQIEEIPQRFLVGLDSRSRPFPELAAELPSLERGTWLIRADGTMETTFSLRQNVRWHDRSLMTADDWVFGWEVDRNPSLPNATTIPMRYIDGVLAPDDFTLIIRYTQTYPFADTLTRRHFNPLQRARHEPTYRADLDRFVNSTAWNFEFLGLGPYRVMEWSQGTQIRFEAFDDYHGGRPKIDTIIARFLQDPNTLVANILSDSIDVYLPLGLEKEAALDLQRTWAAAGTGNQILFYPDGRLRYLEVQMRPEYQRPRGLADRRTREAILRTIDRQELMDSVIGGLGKVADSWLLPDDPARPQFRGVIVEYPRSPQIAQRLLEEVGYRRGGDGILVHQGTGDRFETAVWNTRGGGHERENSIIADHLRSLGMATEQYMVPASRMDDSEHRASFPGTNMSARTANMEFEGALLRYRPPARTLPLGSPRNGYNNPHITALVDRLQVTVPEADRVDLQKQIMELALQDLPILPMYWDVETMTIRKGVTGPQGRTGRHVQYPLATWNVHEWDRA